jgi:hypothetical protein
VRAQCSTSVRDIGCSCANNAAHSVNSECFMGYRMR